MIAAIDLNNSEKQRKMTALQRHSQDIFILIPLKMEGVTIGSIPNYPPPQCIFVYKHTNTILSFQEQWNVFFVCAIKL